MRVSWTGLAGGVLGFGIMVALTVAIAAGAGNGSRLAAVPFGALSTIFVVAIVASVRPVASRQRILKGVVAGCLVMAIVGTVLFGPGVAFLLAPPIGLLAQAAGFIFQAGAPRR